MDLLSDNQDIFLYIGRLKKYYKYIGHNLNLIDDSTSILKSDVNIIRLQSSRICDMLDTLTSDALKIENYSQKIKNYLEKGDSDNE